MNYNLAQLNIARLLAPLDSGQLKDFVDGLEPINELAELAPGFIWRLKGEENNATNYRPFGDDMVIVNMSVWTDLNSLKDFVFKTVHVEYVKRRFEWFERMKIAYMVLWWIPEGHFPTVEEAKERLEYLKEHGETAYAFSFRKEFLPSNN